MSLVPLTTKQGVPAAALWSFASGTVRFNHGSFGAVPLLTQRRRLELISEMESDPDIWFGEVPRRLREAATALSQFLSLEPELTAFVPNASAAASIIAATFMRTTGAEFVFTNHAYGAIRMCFERTAKRVDGVVRQAKVPIGATAVEWVDAILAEVNDRTVMVAIDQITSPTAQLPPLAAIATACHARGVRVMVDGAHAPGQIEAPLGGLNVDYWFGNMHKWAGAPRGCAMLYAATTVVDELYPLIDSWYTKGTFTERFDMQGTVDVTQYLAAPTSLDLIDSELGWARLRAYTSDVLDVGAHALRDVFSDVCGELVSLPPPAPMMRVVPLPQQFADPEFRAEFWRILFNEFRMRVAGMEFDHQFFMRLSCYAYNTPAEFEALAESVREILKRLLTPTRMEPR